MSPRDVGCPTCMAVVDAPCRGVMNEYDVSDHPSRARLAAALATTGNPAFAWLSQAMQPTRIVTYTATSTTGEPTGRKPRPGQSGGLRERVTRDLAAIHEALPAEDFAPAPAECPPPPPEETDTYRVAFGSAARRCTHRRSVDTTYARRERQCLDCGRYFTGESDW